MRTSRPSVLLQFLAVALVLATAPLGAQTIRSVSDAAPRLVPGGEPVQLRLDGSGLDGVTEVRFIKDGREVRGLRAELRTTAQSIILAIVAEPRIDPLEGVEIELRGPRMKRPLRVPAKVLVVADRAPRPSKTDGGKMPATTRRPPPDPPASDPSIQVESIDVEPFRVYAGEGRRGIVRLTAVSSEPVEVEIVSGHPASLEAPGLIVVPAGSLEAEFELRAIASIAGLPQTQYDIYVQARKVPFSSGPTHPVRVLPAPAPEVAVLQNSDLGTGFEMGDNSYSGPPPALPVWSGEGGELRIRLVAPPELGGSIHLTASGPVSVPTGGLNLGSAASDRMLSAEVTFHSVPAPQQAVITVHGYGQQVSETVEVWPDQTFVSSLEAEDCGPCTSTSVVGGDAVRLQVTLARAAEAGGYAVPIQVSDVAALSPVSLTIPAGQSAGELIVGAQPTDVPRTVTLTIGDVVTHTFTITVQPGGQG